MRIDVFTIFPEYLDAPLRVSLLGRARAAWRCSTCVCTTRAPPQPIVHRSVDDEPFGGGAGMVMMPEPLFAAVETAHAQRPLFLLSASGRRFDAGDRARELAAGVGFSLICGRYEGVDQRVADQLCDGELSVGDFVLAGGEAAALVVIEAVARLLPGVLGNDASASEESFSESLLEYPQYTRPAEFRGRDGAGGAAPRRPRPDRALAEGPVAAADAGSPARSARAGADRRRTGPAGRVPRGFTARLASGRAAGRFPGVLSCTAPILSTAPSLRDDIPEFAPGDTLKVHVRVVEGNRERVQVFQGVIIRRQGSGVRETFSVRKVSFGVGVERTFPVHSPIHRQDRGRDPWRRAAGKALLPARPDRKGRKDQGKAGLTRAFAPGLGGRDWRWPVVHLPL